MAPQKVIRAESKSWKYKIFAKISILYDKLQKKIKGDFVDTKCHICSNSTDFFCSKCQNSSCAECVICLKCATPALDDQSPTSRPRKMATRNTPIALSKQTPCQVCGARTFKICNMCDNVLCDKCIKNHVCV